MDITQLRTLVHVAELGSLSRAAERLNTVQPALSRQIRLLEEELQVRLFARHGRGMSVTPIGQEIVAAAARIMGEAETIRTIAADDGLTFRGQIRIGLTPTMSEFMIPELTKRIRADHPKLEIQFKTAFSSYLVDWLQKGELDLVAGYNPPPSPALRVEPVVIEDLFLVGRPGYGLDMNTPVRFADLSGESFVLPARGHALREIVDDCARLAGVRIEASIMADSMRAMLDLVKVGFGVTFLPLAPIYEEMLKGRLEVAPLLDPKPHRRVVMCFPTDRPVQPATRYAGVLFRTISAELVASNKWGGKMLEPDQPQGI
ncbi:MAG: LysR family transcriptional regulator [Roseovarius sp. BRH_c41]|uniref:LysR family transcriptional regulator n=1 Tax=Roseovarius sp. BRH_c41 TaxID=1629709 RepID=UPI0005F22AA3|nr:LysR substrate-binding domain-containing protein [Roseovarius sp. BRH_c41]KJS43132.1 MAG: LysR family transcriptional regulator [Roseovarius sp. BRH_c41]